MARKKAAEKCTLEVSQTIALGVRVFEYCGSKRSVCLRHGSSSRYFFPVWKCCETGCFVIVLDWKCEACIAKLLWVFSSFLHLHLPFRADAVCGADDCCLHDRDVLSVQYTQISAGKAMPLFSFTGQKKHLYLKYYMKIGWYYRYCVSCDCPIPLCLLFNVSSFIVELISSFSLPELFDISSLQ